MSSSRSIAAARARRSNEQAPPVNGSRPITSIGSQAAFAPVSQPPPTNIRLARGQPPQPPQQMYQQPTQQMSSQQIPQQTQGLPFTKLSISDAIGLVTLRLGRVEQFIIDLENGEHQNLNMGSSNIPENSKIIDTSVLTSIINRLDSLEKREINYNNNQQETLVNEEIKLLHDYVKKLNDELVKTNLAAAKHSEQMLRFEREFTENKDILKSLLMKFDLFVTETNAKFGDFDFAISEIEKQIPLAEENSETDNLHLIHNNSINQFQEFETNHLSDNEVDSDGSNIIVADLKNLIKQELANDIN